MAREARCGCGKSVPSDTQGIAFLQRRGPGTQYALETCRHCGYFEVAHRRFTGELMDSVGSGKWPVGVTPHAFEARVEGAEFDVFYCGCRGWD